MIYVNVLTKPPFKSKETVLADVAGVKKVGIVGSGLMGSGIAQVAAVAGFDVVLYDAAEGAAESAVQKIEAALERQVARGRFEADAVAPAVARISVAPTLDGLKDADAVIEAIIENVDIKRDTFAQIAAVVGPETLLATNTSAISISAIAGNGDYADRVIGMHFFSPVPAMQLCEIIRGLATRDETVARARALAEAFGKTTILVNRDTAGFVTSRLITVLTQEAARIVDEGLATARDVDLACTLGFGHKMGPLETADLTGVDVAYRAGKMIYDQTGNPQFAPPQLLTRMVAAGLLGRKTGKGFYDHTEAGK